MYYIYIYLLIMYFFSYLFSSSV